MAVRRLVAGYRGPVASEIAALTALFASGKLSKAEHRARYLIKHYARHPFAWKVLGAVLERMGRADEALSAKLKAVALAPDDGEARHNLGNAWMKLERFAEAEACYRHVLALRPGFAEAHRTLGNALYGLSLPRQAEDSYLRALEINPHDSDAHNNLGNVLRDQGRLHDAEAQLRIALEINPALATAHGNLGNVLGDQGRLDEALSQHRGALALDPDNAELHSNLLFCLLHNESLAPADIFAEHVNFGVHFESPLRASWLPHTNARDPERRLRIGFLSGDLRDHPVAGFIEPVWAMLDPAALELWAYSNHTREDGVTTRLRQYVQHWRMVAGLSDAALAEQIRADGIDILIDLAGHTAHGRLLTCARKPAPLQAAWIGYPGTTGLSAIDYLICDRFNAPHGWYERYYTEQFARLPSTGAFAPSAEAPSVNPLPAQCNGYPTFASFNRPSKLGETVIEAWSRVLAAVPGSRLLVGNVSDAPLAATLAQRFGRYGIAPDRLSFHPVMPLGQYLALHHEVDIVLDTWPYTGGTTTNHALWMGVPVVTMRGPSRAHCQGAAAMCRMGLDDWVADDIAGFVRIAVERARDGEGLAALRRGMRARWRNSPWRDAAVIARGLETALRMMWRRWCAGLPAAHFEVPPTPGRQAGFDA